MGEFRYNFDELEMLKANGAHLRESDIYFLEWKAAEFISENEEIRQDKDKGLLLDNKHYSDKRHSRIDKLKGALGQISDTGALEAHLASPAALSEMKAHSLTQEAYLCRLFAVSKNLSRYDLMAYFAKQHIKELIAYETFATEPEEDQADWKISIQKRYLLQIMGKWADMNNGSLKTLPRTESETSPLNQFIVAAAKRPWSEARIRRNTAKANTKFKPFPSLSTISDWLTEHQNHMRRLPTPPGHTQ